ncbi:uncharacterized protein Dvar_00160 [Desulfosarcina variabilis str. Montpellier]|uniref:hypothetical protein n=1 Tax=Desulfosarcina variabilis TaxID=2300 RepID=UPI003AFB0258
MKNRNFQISNDAHRRLKVLSAQRDSTLGRTIEYLLDVHERVLEHNHTIALQDFQDQQFADARQSMAELKKRLQK